MKIKSKFYFKSSTGFTLIELLIALVIGLIILLGLVTLFTNVSSLNRAQNGLSVLQENGRYAISRLKQDIENSGQKHCASVALPTSFITDWDQGYEMKTWFVDNNINFASSDSTNGLPTLGQTRLDVTGDNDQLSDEAVPGTFTAYPLDSSFFLRGHECVDGSCDPVLTGVGSDLATNFRAPGIIDGSRLPNTDVLTLRYLTGGTRISAIAGTVATTIDPIPDGSTGDALVADCSLSYVTPATWGANAVTMNGAVVPGFSLASKTSVYSMDRDFKTVSYFIGVDDDPNDDGTRVVPSLYRSENGVAQQLVEGVERFDVFYLAQLQTGRVARLSADEVQTIQGGGKGASGVIADDNGCTLPGTIPDYPQHHMPNDAGCLWRSIYAVEIYMLLNTVNDSSHSNNDPYSYSVDSENDQLPQSGLSTGLGAGRMYRKEFSAIVPIRNYTL